MLWIFSCKKEGPLIQDCNIFAQVYAESLEKSEKISLYSWEELKSKHQAFVLGIKTNLEEEERQKLTQNFLLKLRTFVTFACGVESSKQKVTKEIPLQKGQLIKIQHSPHPYYNCLILTWKKNAQNLFLNSCRQVRKI